MRSYPSLRMYPLGTRGNGKYIMYTGFHRDAYSLRARKNAADTHGAIREGWDFRRHGIN